jgi:hypothetical protein
MAAESTGKESPHWLTFHQRLLLVLLQLPSLPIDLISMDWFKGKSTGNHGFYHQI